MPFAPINDQQICKNLRIDDIALEYGHGNKPSDADTTLDPPQLSVVQEFRQFLDNARSQVTEAVRAINEKLHKLSAELQTKPFSDQCKQIPNQLEGQLIQTMAERRGELQTARLAERRLMRDLKFFRAKNKLNREAHYPDSKVFHLSILVAMIAVESLGNAYFFAEGSSLGYTGGWFQSIMVSLLVILVSSKIIGGYLIPQLNHISLKRNILGGTALSISAGVLFVLILLIGHYRHLLTVDPDNALSQTLPHFKDGMFSLDPMSFLFCGVSIAFALSAAIYGFKADDPYPGYGDIDRRYKVAELAYESRKKILVDNVTVAIDGARTKIVSIESEIQAKVHEHGITVPQVQLLISEFNSYADGLEDKCNTLLSHYRSLNQIVRTAPPPRYFSDRFTFGDRTRISSPEMNETDGLLSRFASTQKEVLAIASQVRDQINQISLRQDESLTNFINEIETDAKRSLNDDAVI